jgi:hypothetical protein
VPWYGWVAVLGAGAFVAWQVYQATRPPPFTPVRASDLAALRATYADVLRLPR